VSWYDLFRKVTALENLTTRTLVEGIVPDATAELVSVKWQGSDVLDAVCKDGAGKTIMAGLFIKDLLIRSDLQRCLVVTSDVMRRMVKELLFKFDGTPLFAATAQAGTFGEGQLDCRPEQHLLELMEGLDHV
jgi:hypothetical protein